MRRELLIVAMATACSSGGGRSEIPIVIGQGGTRYFGDTHTGNFWLGPVDFAETEWNNACSPSDGEYPALVQQLYGSYLMGVANEVKLGSLGASQGQLCDTCAELTANGVTLVAHVVTYGDETGPNDIDLSPEARTALHADTQYTGSWRFVTCPTQNPIYYTFDGREWSNTWYFRVWIRNARVPVTKVEYKLSSTWSEMDWQSDGAWQAASQDFAQGFSLRVTSIEGATVEDAIPGIGTFDANAGIASHTNFE